MFSFTIRNMNFVRGKNFVWERIEQEKLLACSWCQETLWSHFSPQLPASLGCQHQRGFVSILNQNFHLLEKVFKLLFSKKNIFSGKVAFQ